MKKKKCSSTYSMSNYSSQMQLLLVAWHVRLGGHAKVRKSVLSCKANEIRLRQRHFECIKSRKGHWMCLKFFIVIHWSLPSTIKLKQSAPGCLASARCWWYTIRSRFMSSKCFANSALTLCCAALVPLIVTIRSRNNLQSSHWIQQRQTDN